MPRSQQSLIMDLNPPAQCETDSALQTSNGRASNADFRQVQDIGTLQVENLVAGNRQAVLLQLGSTTNTATSNTREQCPGMAGTVPDNKRKLPHYEGPSSGNSSPSSSAPATVSPQNSASSSLSAAIQNLEMTSQSLDVFQRREKFSTSGRTENMESSVALADLQNEVKERNNSCGTDPCSGGLECSVQCENMEQSRSQEAGKDKAKSIEASNKVNGKLGDSGLGESHSLSEADAAGHDTSLRRYQHYPFRQAQSEVILPSTVHRRMSLVNVKERGYARLEQELMKAQRALEMKEEEVDELKGIRERLMKEVSDFTAALFEEVNSQLNEAALSEQQARKQLKEANAKIDILTAEVTALKDLVITSTPSSPNRHLNPQIDTVVKKEKGGKPFWKTHRRSTSHHQFTKESREQAEASEQHSALKEFDTVVFDEFARWRLQPTMEFKGQFLSRVQQEDIQPCLSFRNIRLAERLLESVKDNTLSIELIRGDQSFPRKCCLSDSSKLCNYKIKFEGDDEWYSISQMSRNRIAAVCDFYSYLRYIVQGLVKCSDKEIFAELTRLRSQMAQARLGLI